MPAVKWGYGLIGIVFPVFALACAMLILWPGRTGEPDQTGHPASTD